KTRFVAAQSTGCAPIVRAFEEGWDESEAWPDPRTFAAGIRVPKALGDFIVLKALRESGGTAVAVSDDDIRATMRAAGEAEGMLVCPEGAAALAAAEGLRRDGWIGEDEQVVVFNTGTGLKYAESLPGATPRRGSRGRLPPRARSTSPARHRGHRHARHARAALPAHRPRPTHGAAVLRPGHPHRRRRVPARGAAHALAQGASWSPASCSAVAHAAAPFPAHRPLDRILVYPRLVKTLPLSEAKATLSRLVDQVASRDEQIVITRNGKPVAMLVSPDG